MTKGNRTRRTSYLLSIFVLFFGLVLSPGPWAGTAYASMVVPTIGYELTISGNHDAPTFYLKNLPGQFQISNFIITIGDFGYNFDYNLNERQSGGLTWTLMAPDSTNGAMRSSIIQYSFDNFESGSFFLFDAEIDENWSDTTVDYRYVLFDLGGTSNLDNAIVIVNFSNGQTLFDFLPDYESNSDDSYSFSSSIQAVPVPATLFLLGSGLLGLIGIRRRRS